MNFNARTVACLNVNRDEIIWRKPIHLLKFFYVTKNKQQQNKTKPKLKTITEARKNKFLKYLRSVTSFSKRKLELAQVCNNG